MDPRKLTHLNGLYLSELPLDEFARRVREHVARLDWAQGIDEALFLKVCRLMQSRTPVYTQAADWKYFFAGIPDYDERAVRKVLKAEGARAAIEQARAALAASDFTDAGIAQAIRSTEAALGLGEGKLNQPLRVAATGTTIGAGIYETLAVLGRDRSLARIDHALSTHMA